MKKFNLLWIPRGFALLAALRFSYLYFQSIDPIFFVLTILLWIGFFVSLSGKKLVALLYLGITLGGFLLFFFWMVFFVTPCFNSYIEFYNHYLIIIAIVNGLFIIFSVIQHYRTKGFIEPVKPKRIRKSLTRYPFINFMIWVCIAFLVVLLIWDNIPNRFLPSGFLPKQRGVYLEVQFVPTDPARKKELDDNDMAGIHHVISGRIFEALNESANPMEWHKVDKETRIIAIPGYKNLDLIKQLVSEKTSFEVLDETGHTIVTGKNAVYFGFPYNAWDPILGREGFGVAMKWDKEGNQNLLAAYQRNPGQMVKIMTNGKLLASVKLKQPIDGKVFEYLTQTESSKDGAQNDASTMWGSAQSYQVIFKESSIKVCHVGEER